VRAVEAISHVSGFDTFELRQQIIFIRNGERVVTLHVNSDQDANYSEIRDHLVARIEQRLADGAAVRT